MSRPHAPTAAAARVRRFKALCLAAPPTGSLLGAVTGLAVASVRFGSLPSVGVCVLCPLLGVGAGLVVALVVRLAFSRSTVASLFWPSLFGSIVCAWIALLSGRSPSGVPLFYNFLIAAGLGSLAACIGVLVGTTPWLRFTLCCERLAAGECTRCGYSLAGLSTHTCPECGQDQTA